MFSNIFIAYIFKNIFVWFCLLKEHKLQVNTLLELKVLLSLGLVDFVMKN